jgi:hypothetical protein
MRKYLAWAVLAALLLGPVAEAQTSVKVPNVVGKRRAVARDILRDRGLDPEVRKKASSKPKGIVIKQQPTAGRRVNPGRTVLLTVSKGRDCTDGYSPCIPPGPDVDCAGGGGNGPRYEGQGGVPFGPFKVTGSDPYGLDGDGDGVGCE